MVARDLLLRRGSDAVVGNDAMLSDRRFDGMQGYLDMPGRMPSVS